MSLQDIIKESINKDPLALKEALSEELKNRLSVALETKINEETLDEISKATLASYIKKAPANATRTKFGAINATKAAFAGDPSGESRSIRLHQRYEKRLIGVSTAVDKLMRNENLNEETMSYNAVHDLADKHAIAAIAHKKTGNILGHKYHADISNMIIDRLLKHDFGSKIPVTQIKIASDKAFDRHPI